MKNIDLIYKNPTLRRRARKRELAHIEARMEADLVRRVDTTVRRMMQNPPAINDTPSQTKADNMDLEKSPISSKKLQHILEGKLPIKEIDLSDKLPMSKETTAIIHTSSLGPKNSNK